MKFAEQVVGAPTARRSSASRGRTARRSGCATSAASSPRSPTGRYLHVDARGHHRVQARRGASAQRMENELRLSQKLEAVGQLAAGIAHEINTPIQFVGDTIALPPGRLHRPARAQRGPRGAARAPPRPAPCRPRAARARSRDAEELADLEYLRERVPAAFERGADGVSRVGDDRPRDARLRAPADVGEGAARRRSRRCTTR